MEVRAHPFQHGGNLGSGDVPCIYVSGDCKYSAFQIYHRICQCIVHPVGAGLFARGVLHDV